MNASITFILLGVALIFAAVKYYSNRETFKQLTKKEWFDFIVGYVAGWAVVSIIVVGGAVLMADAISAMWGKVVIFILLLFVGGGLAQFIMNKKLPEKLKGFYAN